MTMPREKINPEKKPLEDLTILISEDGVQRKVPALSPHFAGDRPMTPFFVPPSMKENGSFDIGAKEEWFHKMEIFKANLQWLLGLPHHRFWSQIVFGKKTWDSIITYLQEAYPYYAVHHLPDDYEIKERYNEISHLVFCVICRVATQKETEDAWIGKVKFGELLYENTIISLPMLFDFCVIFGNNNKDEINRIISNIFTIQPLYKDDLDSSVQHLKNALNTIEDKFLLSHIKPPDPPLLDSKHCKMGISDIYDLTFYILDSVATLYTFIDTYSEGAMILHLHRFEVSLAQFYEKVFPNLVKTIQEFVGISHPSYETLCFTTNQSRVYVIKLFYLIIQSCLNVIIENRSSFPEELLKYNAESFLSVIKDCLCSKVFMIDYQKTYPLEQDLDVLAQVYPEITNSEYNSILDLVRTNFGSSQGQKNSSSSPRSQHIHPLSSQNSEIRTEPSSSTVKKLSDVEIDSLITEVKDILPHLGEGFILKCLEHYNYKSSDVVNAVLENLLPECLQLIDPDLPIIPPEPGVSEEKGVLSQRVNVFDNDEFDIMNNDHVDTSRIHRGKRKDVKTEELLDDKSFREELRSQFSKFGIVETLDDIYDDEYDDTYDDTVVPLEEEGEAERKFVVPRILQQQKDKEARGSKDYEEESDDYDEDGDFDKRNGKNGFIPFVENPEVIRARREQSRMSRARGRPPPPQRDVVGHARGQGQESDVLKNRAKKNAHKANYGNHNRKKGAQFKRTQGFIPS